MKWLWMSLAALGGVGGLIYLVGALLPREHTAQGMRLIGAASDRVFTRIRDVGARPQWRKSLTRVAIENDRFFTEEGSFGAIRFEVVESNAPVRLVTQIADDKLEFGGRWTITIEPGGTRVKVTVREDGFVKSPVFRFFSRFVFGHTKTIQEFLDDLERSFA